MNNRQFFEKTAYDYRIHALETELAAFRSGKKYIQMEERYQQEIRYLEGIIKKLRKELADARKETVTVRKYWLEVMDDLDAEHKKEIAKKDHEINQLGERVLEVERQRDAAKDKALEKQKELYAVQTELEEAKGLNQKLTAQVNKDFENSSIPSSLQGPDRKKIPNSREETDRKPGGQPGHKGAGRKKQEPTRTVVLPPPDEVQGNPDYYKTGKTKSKQLVSIHLSVETVNYVAEEYRNRKTGARIYSTFPEGVVDDVNYDGTVKAFLCLLNTECNVSIDNARKFLKELTGGKLDISKGMVSSLGREFSGKTKAERQEIISRLMASPVMHADFTNANVNGDSRQVLVLSTPSGDAAMYFAREKKGHEGVKGTPLENYVGIVVHDHDTTFYSYGTKHQECMQHNIRYSKGSIENEKSLEWNVKMLDLIRRMTHYKNNLCGNDPETVAALEKEYDEILDIAQKEYEYEPPSDYYREGYNLFLRLRKYKESELLFLHDRRVPANNSICERLARVYKRKQKQAIVFRSDAGFETVCECLGVIHNLRMGEGNVADKVSEIFDRPKEKVKKGNQFQKKANHLQG